MIRLAGISISAASVLALGFWGSVTVRKRIYKLRVMQKVLHMLKGEIGFSGKILEDAFLDISSRVEEPFRSFFQELGHGMQEEDGTGLLQIWQEKEELLEGNSLKGEDLELFRKLGNELGFLDTEMQLRTLELLEEQVRERIAHLEKNCEVNCRMYRSLGILGALAVMIVML